MLVKRPAGARTISRMSCVGAAFVLVLFSFTYSVLCFHADWVGDIYIYVAAISEVVRDYPHLLHEAGQQPARESIAFTPYFLVLSFIADFVGTSPYHTLQFAGVFNCIMFPLAALYMFKSISPYKEGLVTTALFVLTTIFVRGNNYFWSGELSAETLALISGVPKLSCLVFGDVLLWRVPQAPSGGHSRQARHAWCANLGDLSGS